MPNDERGRELCVITRLEGDSPGVVRLSELRPGDMFAHGDYPGKLMRAMGDPYLNPDGVWTVEVEIEPR